MASSSGVSAGAPVRDQSPQPMSSALRKHTAALSSAARAAHDTFTSLQQQRALATRQLQGSTQAAAQPALVAQLSTLSPSRGGAIIVTKGAFYSMITKFCGGAAAAAAASAISGRYAIRSSQLRSAEPFAAPVLRSWRGRCMRAMAGSWTCADRPARSEHATHGGRGGMQPSARQI